MDFFKSVFSDEPENSDSDSENLPSPSNSQPQTQSPPGAPDTNPNIPAIANAWTFGSGLLKTLASKSESVIQNYRRDLEEFSSGLKTETATIREAASRVVKDLPARLESGAAVAQESLETVGQAIDNIGSTVTEIIVHGKESILADDDSGSEVSDFNSMYYQGGDINLQNLKPYSRIDAAIRAIQCDAKTYCEEPEDLEDYRKWKLGFVFEEKLEEIGDLVEGNIVIAEIYSEIVPRTVDRETFWSRYFYKVYCVKRADEARARLVKRAISGEEELSWDVDDEEEEKNNKNGANSDMKKEIEKCESKVRKLQVEVEQHSLERRKDDKVSSLNAKIDSGEDEKGVSEGRFDDGESSGKTFEAKSEDKGCSEGKNGNSDFSVVSSQPSSHGEEDLGWDEIEDISSGDESKVAARVSPNKADLLKRLSMPDEEEELTWDIEDDDEPVKS
ncbi:PREDICTED: BSD domain-containing protein 1-like [Ipomoea nil]|uniref:BSD domain-containing protein 1-like n=1 Tax=Ipomoea nil TaxID=35883 RepID=UPI000900C962|nr:PREDICTED: BSD domain-containing protein 1-like [Ipomoea nil]